MDKNTNLEEKIIKFLLDPNNKDNYEGYEVFKRVFLKEFFKEEYALLRKFYDGEDLFNEFLVRVIFREDGFLLNNNMKEKINNIQHNFLSYLFMSIHNFLRTYRRKAKFEDSFKEQKSMKLESIQTSDNRTKDLLEYNARVHIDYSLHIEAQEILESIKKDFSEKELRTLCYMFLNEKKYYGEEITDDNAYKRKSRMKKTLSEYINKKGFSLQGFALFVKEYLMSEICKKLC